MLALNHDLERNIVKADGRYLTSDEMRPLENYLKTYKLRLETYHQISQQSDAIVLQALRRFARIHPDVIQKHGQRCRFDMGEVLRYMALSILRDDEFFFQEKMIFWLDTVLRAHHKQTICSTAYRYLQEALDETLSSAQCDLIRPYINLITESLQTYA